MSRCIVQAYVLAAPCDYYNSHFPLFYPGASRPGLFHESAELGPRELRFPAEQDSQVQCPPGAEVARGLQVPAANAQQGVGKSAQFLLRELPRAE